MSLTNRHASRETRLATANSVPQREDGTSTRRIAFSSRRDKIEPSARRLVRAAVDERPVAAEDDIQSVAGGLDRVHARRGSVLGADGEALPGRRRRAGRRQRVVSGLVGRHELPRARELERAGVGDVRAVECRRPARCRGRGDEVRVRAGGRNVVARGCVLDGEGPVRVLRERAAYRASAGVRPRSDEVELVGKRLAGAYTTC